MKKFLLLSLLAIGLASCSTDSDFTITDEQSVVFSTVEAADANTQRAGQTAAACFSSVTGDIDIDLSNGIDNPIIIFNTILPTPPPGTISQYYTIGVEMQLLADCENLTIGTGPIIKYSLPAPLRLPAATIPGIALQPSQLPATCFRWRIVVQGTASATRSSGICLSYSQWYDEPIF